MGVLVVLFCRAEIVPFSKDASKFQDVMFPSINDGCSSRAVHILDLLTRPPY